MQPEVSNPAAPAPARPGTSQAVVPALDRLLIAMQRTARFACESIARSRAEFGAGWADEMSALIERCYPEDTALGDAARGYGAFAMDSMRRQKRFERDRVYPAKTYAEASAEVYLNADHMRRQYLPGLLLSHYLWAHHYRQIQYFRQFFLDWMRTQRVASVAEVGVGTGIYTRLTLQALPEVRATGFDISPTSLQFTQAHAAAFGLGSRLTLEQRNVVDAPPPERFGAVLCIEVLEHLEDPTIFLRALRAMCRADGRLFVTAALNAADADHIYLYRNPQEVLSQVAEAGLHVEHCFFTQAYLPPGPALPVPGALAMVLTPLP